MEIMEISFWYSLFDGTMELGVVAENENEQY